MFEAACKPGQESIISKKIDAISLWPFKKLDQGEEFELLTGLSTKLFSSIANWRVGPQDYAEFNILLSDCFTLLTSGVAGATFAINPGPCSRCGGKLEFRPTAGSLRE